MGCLYQFNDLELQSLGIERGMWTMTLCNIFRNNLMMLTLMYFISNMAGGEFNEMKCMSNKVNHLN